MLEFAQVREDYIADNSQVREDKQYIKDLGNGRPAQARRAEESGVGGWGHSRHHLGDLRCWKGHCHERRSWTWSCNRQWVSFLLKTGTAGAGSCSGTTFGSESHGTDGIRISRFGEESATVGSIDADDVANLTDAGSGHLVFIANKI